MKIGICDLAAMAYKSPIETVTQNLMNEINNDFDNQVMTAVHRAGVYVDQEELVKALDFDREQFQKGFEAGYKEAIKRFDIWSYHGGKYGSEYITFDKGSVSDVAATMARTAVLALEKLDGDRESYEFSVKIRKGGEFVEGAWATKGRETEPWR